MGRSFINTTRSHKRAYAGFLPNTINETVIINPNGNDVIPATILCKGTYPDGANPSITFSTDAPSGGSIAVLVSGESTAEEVAALLVTNANTKPNLRAELFGTTVRIFPDAAANTVLLS